MNNRLLLILLILGVVAAGAVSTPSIGLAEEVPADQAVAVTATPQAETSNSLASAVQYVQGDFHVYYWYWNGYYWQKILYGVRYSRHEADHDVEGLRQSGWTAWWEFRYH